MSVRLPDCLDLIACAPKGIDKLRGLILELAVRGKLVPQDPKDEPAAELLKRVNSEAADKKTRLQPPVEEDKQPFSVPASWKWVRFGSIAQHNSGKTLDKGRNAGQARDYITTSNLYWGRFELASVRQMLIRDEELEKCTARKNDLLICEGGEAGRAAVWELDREICFQNHVHRARLFANINPYFAFRVFERLNASGEINRYRQGVGISNMSGKALASIPFPLPPLAEQQRIVAKVDELMALCDRLESEQADSDTAHARLVETLLGTLTQSADADELDASWQLLAGHFDTLFATEASLIRLKQTILQLAVMGRLVPQDPTEEPVNSLLNRIADQRARFELKGIGQKSKPLALAGESEAAFALPVGWKWVSFGQATICRDGERIPVSRDDRNLREKQYDYYGASGVIDKIDGFLFDKPLLLIGEDGANLINRSTPIAFVARGKYWVNNHAHVIDGISEVFLRFIELYINAIDLKPYITGTAQPKMNQAKMNGIPVALPPESEQHRIVAKVDELMALCDRLKADLVDSRSRQARLTDTLIAAALEAA